MVAMSEVCRNRLGEFWANIARGSDPKEQSQSLLEWAEDKNWMIYKSDLVRIISAVNEVSNGN